MTGQKGAENQQHFSHVRNIATAPVFLKEPPKAGF